MNYALLFLAFIVGVVLCYLFIRRGKASSNFSEHNAARRQKVEEAKEKIMQLLESSSAKASEDGQARITNDDVEKMLGVSNNTVIRYLDELEKEGKLRQVGETGKYTYYEKI